LEERPESPELLVDLASAYFQRAEAVDHPIDYGKAVDILGRVLSKRPDDAVALFNRAIASEKVFLYTQAVEDWEHYVRVDPSGDWAKEAHRRLDDLRLKLKKHAESSSEPLLSASVIARTAVTDVRLYERIDQRIEEYVAIAIDKWLPKAYPLRAARKTNPRDFQKALKVVAEITSRLHHDPWLADLLSGEGASSFPAAVNELSAALEANNKAGDAVAAKVHAVEANRLFAVAHNKAGIERAGLEDIFASQLEQNGVLCMQSATAIRRMLEKGSHRWLQIQFHLEEGTCLALVGDLGSAKELYSRAAREAETSGYKVIFLRTQDHASSMDCIAGAFPSSWARTRQALDRFWSGHYPPMRGYNLYYNLFECSRMAGEPYLQAAAWRDGVVLSDTFTDNTLRAMAHVLMADAATAIEAPPQVAARELAEASHFFNDAPPNKATRVAR